MKWEKFLEVVKSGTRDIKAERAKEFARKLPYYELIQLVDALVDGYNNSIEHNKDLEHQNADQLRRIGQLRTVIENNLFKING